MKKLEWVSKKALHISGMGGMLMSMLKDKFRVLMMLSILAAVFSTQVGTSCRKPVKPEPVEPVPLDAAALISEVRDRGDSIARMDAGLELTLTGTEPPYRGKFFGSLNMERSPDGDIKLLLQVYSLMGAPVLELVSDGERVQIFSPLDNALFYNFNSPIEGMEYDRFPLSSFSEVALPLNLIMQQVGLVWDSGYSDSFEYLLSTTENDYLLSEWNGDELRREIVYRGGDLFLERVKLYRGGILAGGMECSGHPGGPGPGSWVPTSIELYQDPVRLKLELSQTRFNDDVSVSSIEFREPGPKHRVILLTPPVP